MTEPWPPPGHSFTYDMKIELENDDLPTIEAEVTVLGGRSSDLAAFRWGRLDGPSTKDRMFREELYRRVGAITVASGHAEAAMKRVLLVAKGQDSFADAEHVWSTLEKKLRAIDPAGFKRKNELDAHLAWAERAGVKRRRDDAIHAYWWDLADVGVTRSRFRRDGSSEVILGTMKRLETDAELIFEYAQRLDGLVLSEWPQARLRANPAI